MNNKGITDFDISRLKFDSNGLIPAIVTDYYTNQVLTLAYMNEESLRLTLSEGRTCFYSRSRSCLWRKGETSGNVQKVVYISADCDYDALKVAVKKAGPACHTGSESCFFNELYSAERSAEEDSLAISEEEVSKLSEGDIASEGKADNENEAGKFSVDQLYALLYERSVSRPEGSYTSYLFDKGMEKILKKVGEESTEVIIAAMKASKEEATYETADLCYHVLVMMVAMGITPEDVRAELAKRHVIDKKVKQETMK